MGTRRRHSRSDERGLTLMELMLTLAIVAVGILGLTSMNVQSARAVQDAAEISLATNLASATLDEIQVSDYTEITLGVLDDIDGDGTDDFPVVYDRYGRALPPDADIYFTVTAEVEAESPSLGFKDLLITVSWDPDGDPTSGPKKEVDVRGRIRQLARGN